MTLAFIDTETTSLRPDRRAWEVGLIVRGEADSKEYRWFVDVADLDLGNADPFALKIGKFYDRHPQVVATTFRTTRVPDFGKVHREPYVLQQIEQLTRGTHLVGAVVSFDAEVLAARMRANGICPSWHYHLIDVEALAVGALGGFDLPWKSDDLTAALGVPPTPESDRHTALGDAKWARAIYDAVVGNQPDEPIRRLKKSTCNNEGKDGA